jgi:hypothetical protein
LAENGVVLDLGPVVNHNFPIFSHIFSGQKWRLSGYPHVPVGRSVHSALRRRCLGWAAGVTHSGLGTGSCEMHIILGDELINHPKIIQKSSKNHPKIIHKSSKYNP